VPFYNAGQFAAALRQLCGMFRRCCAICVIA
jgi:hypothetical protein